MTNLPTTKWLPGVGGWVPARHLAIRSESGKEQVAMEISFVSSPNIIAGANCHHATRRARDHPYLARQLSDGEIWTAHGGVNPCGLVVRWGDRELRTRWLCYCSTQKLRRDTRIR
jgi:hypothetical protein